MPTRHPFNKPAQEVIVDLLNQSLIRKFLYNTVDVAPIATTFSGPSCLQLPALWPQHHCRERASFVATVEGYKNSLQCNYHKLYIGRHLPDSVVVGDSSSSEEEILDALQARYNVLLDPDEVVVDIYGLPVEEGAYRCVVRPMLGHLVWEGELDLMLVDVHHIALSTPVRHLGTVDLSGDADVAQEISVPMVDDIELVDIPEPS